MTDLTPAIKAARAALGSWIEPQYGDLISPLNADRVLSVIVEAAAPVLLAEAAGLQRVVDDQEARLIAQAKRIEELERNEISAIDDAIRNEEWADKLAAATAEHFGVDIGEHSNDNSPWANALEAFTDAVDPHVRVEAQSREIGNLARQNAELRDRDKVLTGRLVEAWHQGCGGDAPLCNYLGLTWEQYQQRFGPHKYRARLTDLAAA